MKRYHVSWELDVEAESPVGAAVLAQRRLLCGGNQRLPLFDVTDPDGATSAIDLQEEAQAALAGAEPTLPSPS